MNERRKDLSDYRLSEAFKCVEVAEKLVSMEEYKTAANRAYYAIFHGIRSILALEGVDFKKHSAVGAYFRKEYVKTGVFDPEYSDILRDSFEVRRQSDYDDFYILSKERTIEQIVNARKFLDRIKEYLDRK